LTIDSHLGPMNLTALTLYIDTNVVDATDPPSVFLRQLGDVGWIYLERTDTMDTELLAAPADKLPALLTASAQYPEAMGPMVWDHSRWGHAVWGSPEDAARLARVDLILHGRSTAADTKPNNWRDTMHLATAIKYAAYGFVTCDKRILNKAPKITDAFADFRLLSPVGALALTRPRGMSLRHLHELEPYRGELPQWPADADWKTVTSG